MVSMIVDVNNRRSHLIFVLYCAIIVATISDVFTGEEGGSRVLTLPKPKKMNKNVQFFYDLS